MSNSFLGHQQGYEEDFRKTCTPVSFATAGPAKMSCSPNEYEISWNFSATEINF